MSSVVISKSTSALVRMWSGFVVFGSDTVPGCYEDLELADLLVLVCPMILAGAGFRLLWKGGKIYLRFAK